MITVNCDYCNKEVRGNPDDFHKLSVFDEVSLKGKRVVVNYAVTASGGHICLSCAQEAVGVLIGMNQKPLETKKKAKRAKTIDDL